MSLEEELAVAKAHEDVEDVLDFKDFEDVEDVDHADHVEHVEHTEDAEHAEHVEHAEDAEKTPVPESITSPDKLADVEFSVCEPEVLVEYFRGLVTAALPGGAAEQGSPRNVTIRFTCPPRAMPALALEELAGLMTRAGDTLRAELAAAAAAAEGDGRKRRQTSSIQPLAYLNRRPAPPAAAETARSPSHTAELSEAFAKLRHGPQKRSIP